MTLNELQAAIDVATKRNSIPGVYVKYPSGSNDGCAMYDWGEQVSVYVDDVGDIRITVTF